MTWLELFEIYLIVSMSTNNFTFWHQLSELSNGGEEHLLIGSFEVLVLLSI
jgi:hypothetical protein